MPDTDDRLAYFQSWFENIRQYIIDLPVPEHRSDIERKTLYAAYIDALSRFVFPNSSSNKKRYIDFIEHVVKWPHANRVSTPLLHRLLKKCPEPEFNLIRAEIGTLFATWSPGNLISIDRDPTFEDVRRKWPQKDGKLKVVGKLALEDLKHANLFYRYRNSLIHEFRPLASGFSIIQSSTPCYMHVSASENYWSLLYTSNFLEAITADALTLSVQHFRENGLNPLDYVTDLTHWFEELQ